ncbi:thiamine pyrophosphate-requiring protein [Terrihalobacillus insolitus]|uniref:thiamine pyrophosphate-requiring protein n=1 Tax=Terrihalobacillus insolitus TaxID=2950438 RepID=UPI0023419920|nr:thiamine pyrophosphate-requiring protein [Terrihalobacillus insolitus]MDC3411904.1 thiamine pyrophosphate-requiring protein [Terrihalobacillus insolitus]
MGSDTYKTADALLDALQETDVSYLFSNLGSDHPAIIEALAKAKDKNRTLPQVIICPHEYVALSAAHGYYLLSGEAQAVFVHTDVGTQNLGGSLHNVARSRVPVFIFSGETPYTMNGELPGTRNSHINYLQNVYDQRGIVRGYIKWENDIRTGKNVKQLVYRAMQLAKSEPQGPVYLTGAREPLEEEVTPSDDLAHRWKAQEKAALPMSGVKRIVNELIDAENPVILTSYLGRNTEAVEQLITFCEKLAIPMVESNPSTMNFPTNHPLHLGFKSEEVIPNADVILVLDSDVPWIPSQVQPKQNCKLYYIDVDPIKEDIPFWHFPAEERYQADVYQSLIQLNSYINQKELNEYPIRKRYHELKNVHDQQRSMWKQQEVDVPKDVITPEWLTVCVRKVIDDDTIILNETITNAPVVARHLPRIKPGTMFINGGSSLGWNGGAALGVKLAAPDKQVVSLTGDASYLFSVPSSVYWMSRRYNAPFLTVIYNNQGWNATKNNLLKLYPDGVAQRDDRYWVNFDKPADLSIIAEAAGGAFAMKVSNPEKLLQALKLGMEKVKSGQSAVIDVILPNISNQKD